MPRTFCLLALLLAACAPVVMCRPLVEEVAAEGVLATLNDKVRAGRELQSAVPNVNVKVSLQGVFDEAQIGVVQAAITKVLSDNTVKFDKVVYVGKIDVVGKRKLQQLTTTLYVLEFEVLGLLDTAQADLAIVTLSLIPIEAAVLNLVGAVVTAVVAVLESLLGGL